MRKHGWFYLLKIHIVLTDVANFDTKVVKFAKLTNLHGNGRKNILR